VPAAKKHSNAEDREVDALFMLPPADFTNARNALAKKLKQANRTADAVRVKALAKPSISAWAVNQLYWKHRAELDRLLAAGAVLGQAHVSQLAGKTADLRGPMAAKREAVSVLLRLADTMLREGGHSSAPDTRRRIETTLETLSNSPSGSSNPILGRLSQDLAPLGFESLAALVQGVPLAPSSVRTEVRGKPTKEALASAKAALKDAEQSLRDSQAVARNATKAVTRAETLAKQREEVRHQAEELYEKARAGAEEARLEVAALSAQAEAAQRAVQSAVDTVERVRAEVQVLEKKISR
jgi:hypothetical protein